MSTSQKNTKLKIGDFDKKLLERYNKTKNIPLEKLLDI